MVATALFALQVADHVTVPVLSLVPFLLAYPAVRLLGEQGPYARLDYAYLLVTFAGLAGVLAFSSPYPVGYRDVHNHLFATEYSLADGDIRFSDTASTSFVGLYLLTVLAADLTGLAVPQVARVVPLVAVPLAVVTFYHTVSRQLLPARVALFSAVVFGLNWGVFRFAVEYRTLTLALPFMLVLLSLYLRWFDARPTSRSTVAVFLLVTAALAITHLTTYVFYLVLVAAVLVTCAIDRTRIRPGYLATAVAAPLLYMGYVAGSLGSFLRYMRRQVTAQLVAQPAVESTETVAAEGGQGVVGFTYGLGMFLAQWAVRLVFIAAFGVFVLLWLREREAYSTFVVVSAVGLGLLTVLVTATGFILNPSRVLTFFAVPYALVYAAALLVAYDVTTASATRSHQGTARLPFVADGGRIDRRVRSLSLDRLHSSAVHRAVSVAAVVVLALMLTTTMLRFPAAAVGQTEPVRGESVVDGQAHMYLGDATLDARGYLDSTGVPADSVSTAYGTSGEARTMGTFFAPAKEGEPTAGDGCDCQYTVAETGAYRDGANGSRPESLLYDNGETRVFYAAGDR